MTKSALPDMIEASAKAALLLLVAIAGGAYRDAAQARPFTVADNIALRRFVEFENAGSQIYYAPDRQFFAVLVETGRLDLGRPESILRVYRVSDIEAFREARPTNTLVPVVAVSVSQASQGVNIKDVRWLRDSSGLTYLAADKDGRFQLYFSGVNGSDSKALTAAEESVRGYAINDTANFVYAVQSLRSGSERADAGASDVIDVAGHSIYELMTPEERYPELALRHDLSELVLVQQGKQRPLLDQAGAPITIHESGIAALALSPDNKAIITARSLASVPKSWETLYPPPFPGSSYRFRAGRQEPEALDGQDQVSQYVLIDTQTGAWRSLTDAPIAEPAGWWHSSGADWSRDGGSIVLSNSFINPDKRKEGADQSAMRPCIVVVDFQADASPVCALELKSLTNEGWEEGYRLVRSVRFSSSDNRLLELRVSDLTKPGNRVSTIFIHEVEPGIWRETGDKPAEQTSRLKIQVEEDLNVPPGLIVGAENTSAFSIWSPNDYLEEVELGDAGIYRWTDETGREWSGVLYLPPGAEDGDANPLVIQTHGYIADKFLPSGLFSTAYAARALAAQGVAVVQIENCPGIGPDESACQRAGFKSLIGALSRSGKIDSSRVGILGYSRSAFYVLDALAFGQIEFRAALVSDGFNPGYLQYLFDVDSYEERGRFETELINGGPPFGEGLLHWADKVALFNFDTMNTPLAVAAAEGPQTLMAMWEPYAVLRYLEKPVEFFYISAIGTHPLSNPAHQYASQQFTVDWFAFWLTGKLGSADSDLREARWRHWNRKYREGVVRSNERERALVEEQR